MWYVTREQLARATAITLPASRYPELDRHCGSASRKVERDLHRVFWPRLDTKLFRWPPCDQAANPYRYYLSEHDLVSLTTLISGGETLTGGLLEPQADGPPFTAIELSSDGSESFTEGDAPQRSLSITGLWGWADENTTVGTITANVATTTATTIEVSDPWSIGVGDLIKVNDERMTVTDRAMADTGQNTGGSLSVSKSDVTVPVTDGTAFGGDQILLIDSERVRVFDVAGNTLTVVRSEEGSVLAAHTSGADIFTASTLTVERGAGGTTAATHTSGDTVTRWDPEPGVRELALAEAISTTQQELSGYVQIVGQGEGTREAQGRGLRDIRKTAKAEYGRNLRTMAI